MTGGGGVVTFLEELQLESVDRGDIDKSMSEENSILVELEGLKCLLRLLISGQRRISKVGK